jgi:hypothetical protein
MTSDKVVPILTRQPHLEGPCLCLYCKHRWEGIAQVGNCISIECPNCLLHKGIFSGITYPEMAFMCECGNTTFAYSGISNANICTLCGLSYTWEMMYNEYGEDL